MYSELYKAFSQYNQRMNENLIEVLMDVPNEVIEQDQKAFFGSIFGTFQHIMVADLVWLSRFSSFKELAQISQILEGYPKIESLNQRLFDNFLDFSQKRKELDQVISVLVSSIPEDLFTQELKYKKRSGETVKKPFWTCLSHFFNHQTHHRGQITTLLNQIDVDFGVTDFVHLVDG